jgi:enediyne biosynthesis protein E4
MTRTLAVLLAVAGCGSRLPDPVCDEGASPWSPGTDAYVEVTAERGLEGVVGTRMVAVDFDGDGWTDLHVHRGSLGQRGSFSEEGPRRSWLLRNDEGRGFVDVTRDSGFRTPRDGDPEAERAGSIVAFGDVDNDGDLDAFTAVVDEDGTATPDTSELLLNQGDGTFVLGAEDLPFRLDADGPAGATFVDVDKDGNLDLWVPRNTVNGVPAQDRLYLGDGAGGFRDATADAGLATADWADPAVIDAGEAHSRAWSANACDLNDDGWPELLAASYGRAPNHLWRNDGDGTFSNASVASGYAYDTNQDYIDNQFFRCFCTRSPSADRCDEAAPPDISCSQNNWREPMDRNAFRNGGNSGATSCRDVDNDGHIDLLTGEIQHWWAGDGSDEAELLFNTGADDIVFERPGNEVTGLTRDLPAFNWDKGDMTNTLFDFDNDGWADVYIGSSDYADTRGLLWHQRAPRQFEAVATGDFFEHNRSHGVAVADFDRDGDLDIVVGHSRSRCGNSPQCYETQQVRLFDNQLGGNFLQLDLVGGEGSNRRAVGARVTVTAGDVTQTLEVGGGYGHYGAQNPHIVHAGLGGACEAEVTVRWPDAEGTTESWTLPAGYRWRLTQGDDPGPTDVSPGAADEG